LHVGLKLRRLRRSLHRLCTWARPRRPTGLRHRPIIVAAASRDAAGASGGAFAVRLPASISVARSDPWRRP
jgi:hypothetical protein